MSSDRVDIFATEGDGPADVSVFVPKERKIGPTRQELDAITGPKFISREPQAAPELPVRKAVFRHRTGRTVQFNARMRQVAVDRYNALRDETGKPMGEILELALAAYLRELEQVEGKKAGEGGR